MASKKHKPPVWQHGVNPSGVAWTQKGGQNIYHHLAPTYAQLLNMADDGLTWEPGKLPNERTFEEVPAKEWTPCLLRQKGGKWFAMAIWEDGAFSVYTNVGKIAYKPEEAARGGLYEGWAPIRDMIGGTYGK